MSTDEVVAHSRIVAIPKRTDANAAGRATSEYVLTGVSIFAGVVLIVLGVLAGVPESVRNELIGYGAALIGVPTASYNVTRGIIKGALAQGAAVVQAEAIRKQPRNRPGRPRSSARSHDA